MTNNCYRLLQMTNNSIGAVAVNTNIPLGIMTREIAQDTSCKQTFTVTTSVNNAVYLNESGFYKIMYNGYLAVAAAGDIVINLVFNGQIIHTATVTVGAAGTYFVSFTFVVRLFDNCCSSPTNIPALIQVSNTGIALTGGNSNMIIERLNVTK